MIPGYLRANPRVMLAAILVAIVALIDWRVDASIAFGFLYLFPVLLVGTVWRRWQILLTALLCTLLADLFDPFKFTLGVALPQDILVLTSLAGTGLFAYEISKNRRQEAENLKRVERESAARREAEEQLEFLIDNSPAAILTMTPGGDILLANSAAHRLLGVESGCLPGKNMGRYIPALGRVPSVERTPKAFRTEMQCRGERENGDVFLANVFFSTYRTAVGPRLAALVVDASEDLREREELGLEQLLTSSRILMGAVSHEVRNVCGAIAVVHENLARSGVLSSSQDFEALGSLVETLMRIASLELKQSAGDCETEGADLFEILDDLRIVLEPYCQDADVELRWALPDRLPPVLADRHSLMQALLNLTKNSERALAGAQTKRIDIVVTAGPNGVALRVTDTGPGLGSTEDLFHPFQKGADATGLGLYLSRALVRSFRGDLRHEPTATGCCFVIDLALATPNGTEYQHARTHGKNTAAVSR